MASRSGVTRAVNAAAPPEHRSLLGKLELASELGWTRPRLDRYLAAHADFPVAGRGVRGPLYDVGQVRSFIDRASKPPREVDGGRRPAVPTPPVDDRIVGKKELAAELGWPRPKLDRFIDRTRSIFPIRKQGDRSGGWEFSVSDVKAFLAGLPIPSRSGTDASGAPPALELFDADDFEASTAALRPRCLPIANTEPCRTDGLSEHHLGIILSCFEFLPSDGVDGGFENVVAAAVEAARLGAHRIIDYCEAELARLPDPVPLDATRNLFRTEIRMVGALLDVFEHTLLEMPRVPAVQRDYVRTMFDGMRAAIVADYERQFV